MPTTAPVDKSEVHKAMVIGVVIGALSVALIVVVTVIVVFIYRRKKSQVHTVFPINRSVGTNGREDNDQIELNLDS